MSIGTLADTLRLGSRQVPQAALHREDLYAIELSCARVRYLDTGGEGPVAVIAPDPPNTIEHHLEMVGELRKTHRVVVVDMPGFGFSFPKFGFGFDLSEQSAALAEFMDALDLRNAILVFSCLAHFAALHLGVLRPDRVAQLVLAQAPSREDSVDWARRMDDRRLLGTPIVGQMLMATKGRAVARGWYRAALQKGADTSSFYDPAASMLARGGCYCLASAFQRFSKADVDFCSDVAQPVTVFWGALDRTHRPSNPEGIRMHVPHAEVRILDNCAHFPDLECSEEIIAAVRA